MDKSEKRFQLELERFKQKASWENKIFYTFLGVLISIIFISSESGKFLGIKTIYWLLIMAIFLIVGEFLVNKYLDNHKDKIMGEIK